MTAPFRHAVLGLALALASGLAAAQATSPAAYRPGTGDPSARVRGAVTAMGRSCRDDLPAP